MSRRRTVAKYGTNEEVFNGEALLTKNHLTAAELLLDTATNKVISAAAKRLPKQAKAATKYPVSVTGTGVVLAVDVLKERKDKLAAQKEAKSQTVSTGTKHKVLTEPAKPRKGASVRETFSSNSVPRVSPDMLLAARRPTKEDKPSKKKKEKPAENKKLTEDTQTKPIEREVVEFYCDKENDKYQFNKDDEWYSLDDCKELYMERRYDIELKKRNGHVQFVHYEGNKEIITLTSADDQVHYVFNNTQKLSRPTVQNILVDLFDLLFEVRKVKPKPEKGKVPQENRDTNASGSSEGV